MYEINCSKYDISQKKPFLNSTKKSYLLTHFCLHFEQGFPLVYGYSNLWIKFPLNKIQNKK